MTAVTISPGNPSKEAVNTITTSGNPRASGNHDLGQGRWPARSLARADAVLASCRAGSAGRRMSSSSAGVLGAEAVHHAGADPAAHSPAARAAWTMAQVREEAQGAFEALGHDRDSPGPFSASSITSATWQREAITQHRASAMGKVTFWRRLVVEARALGVLGAVQEPEGPLPQREGLGHHGRADFGPGLGDGVQLDNPVAQPGQEDPRWSWSRTSGGAARPRGLRRWLRAGRRSTC